MVDNWLDIYSKFFQELFEDVDGSDIRDVTLGVFRMNKDYFNKIRKRETRSDIYFSDYSIEEGVVVVDSETRQFAMNEFQNLLSKFISKDKILVWK
jgi:spore photoproduct lyase